MDKKNIKVIEPDPYWSNKSSVKALAWTVTILNDLNEKITKHYSKNEEK